MPLTVNSNLRYYSADRSQFLNFFSWSKKQAEKYFSDNHVLLSRLVFSLPLMCERQQQVVNGSFEGGSDECVVVLSFYLMVFYQSRFS